MEKGVYPVSVGIDNWKKENDIQWQKLLKRKSEDAVLALPQVEEEPHRICDPSSLRKPRPA
jgi:hypothetical protein